MTINSLIAIVCIVVTAAGWGILAGTVAVAIAILDYQARRRDDRSA